MITRYSPMSLAHHKRTTGETREKRATRRLKSEGQKTQNFRSCSLARTELSRSLLEWSSASSIMLVVALLAACGEPMFENAGSPNSLLEDREACVTEIDQSPAARAYRKNPTAHPDYPNQVFEEMTQCIERKGWKQVRSQQEQERLREATMSELAHSPQPTGLPDAKAREAFARSVEDRLAR